MRARRPPSADDDKPDVTLPPHGSAPPPSPEAPRMACPGCSASTLTTELAQFGNRCSSCYAAFCQASQVTRAQNLPDKRSQGPLAWAHAIVERHRQGQPVTPVTLQMARDALRGPMPMGDGE